MSVFAPRPSPAAMSEASRTVTLLETEHTQDIPAGDEPVGALRLRGAPRQRTRETQRVVWRDDVVDNEGAGKKSSKSELSSVLFFSHELIVRKFAVSTTSRAISTSHRPRMTRQTPTPTPPATRTVTRTARAGSTPIDLPLTATELAPAHGVETVPLSSTR